MNHAPRQQTLPQAKPQNVRDFCRDRAAPPGSPGHYRSLFVPAAQRRPLWAVEAFCLECDHIGLEIEDDTVAAARIDFWRQELAGPGTHPIRRDLEPWLASDPHAATLLGQRLEAAEWQRQYSGFRDWGDLEPWLYRHSVAPWMVISRGLGLLEPATLRYCQPLGEGLALTGLLTDLGALARRGRIYLPSTLLEQHALSPTALLTSAAPAGLQPVLEEVDRRARARLLAAGQALPEPERQRQLPALIAMTQAQRQLARLRRQGWRVLERPLPPPGPLWLFFDALRLASRYGALDFAAESEGRPPASATLRS